MNIPNASKYEQPRQRTTGGNRNTNHNYNQNRPVHTHNHSHQDEDTIEGWQIVLGLAGGIVGILALIWVIKNIGTILLIGGGAVAILVAIFFIIGIFCD
jgi:hypothetical protein